MPSDTEYGWGGAKGQSSIFTTVVFYHRSRALANFRIENARRRRGFIASR
jgi:hypothetical protein